MSALAAITGVTSLTNNFLREYMGNARAPPTSIGPGPRQWRKVQGSQRTGSVGLGLTVGDAVVTEQPELRTVRLRGEP